MNSNKVTIGAIAAIAVAMAFAVVPALTSAAYAVKTEVPEDCEGVGGDFTECPGASGSGVNKNRVQIECTVTGGGGDPVPGQVKQFCGED